jgi:hypothetical protein
MLMNSICWTLIDTLADCQRMQARTKLLQCALGTCKPRHACYSDTLLSFGNGQHNPTNAKETLASGAHTSGVITPSATA